MQYEKLDTTEIKQNKTIFIRIVSFVSLDMNGNNLPLINNLCATVDEGISHWKLRRQ